MNHRDAVSFLERRPDRSGRQPRGLNQSPVFEDVDLSPATALQDAVAGERSRPALPEALIGFRMRRGTARMCSIWGGWRMRIHPSCGRFDQKGLRRDAVEFHPAYHELMALSLRTGCMPRLGRCGRRTPARRARSHARRGSI